MSKRILSILLAMVMVFTMIPLSVVATEGEFVYLSVSFDGKYIDDKNGTVYIIEFDNTLYGVSISKDQQNRNELDEGSSALDSEYNQIIEVYEDMTEEIWNSLTQEEKAKLIASLGKN